jgi:RNA polymerase sigma-70 factor (ECF subfamily)
MPAIDLVYSIARRCVKTRDDAEDLVQETYLAAYRAWLAHRRPRRVEPWLATICLNLARSRFRTQKRRPNEVSVGLDPGDRPSEPWWSPADAVESSALSAIDRDMVHRALWRLTDDQRVAITLVDLVGFSTAEAARITHTPRGTVLSRLHRGRKALAGLVWDQVEERGVGGP